jgi:hypothetical protein
MKLAIAESGAIDQVQFSRAPKRSTRARSE